MESDNEREARKNDKSTIVPYWLIAFLLMVLFFVVYEFYFR